MKYLGKFEIHEQLGRGGFGTVYRAIDNSLDREVAIKILHPQLTVDEEFINEFRKEAKTLAMMDNNHIVIIYEMGEIEGHIFIAMRYLPGGNLKEVIRQRGQIPYDEAVTIFTQIAEGLGEAYNKGLVHRDLKPENILFDANKNAFISDFGLAKGKSSGTPYSIDSILGTPNYIAPEIWSGEPATCVSDLYSLGCIFYEMLTGKLLFEGNSIPEVMKKHFDGLTLPNSWPKNIPNGINEFFRKSLAEKKEERYQNINEMISAIKNLEMKNVIFEEKEPQKDYHLGTSVDPSPHESTKPVSKNLDIGKDISPKRIKRNGLMKWGIPIFATISLFLLILPFLGKTPRIIEPTVTSTSTIPNPTQMITTVAVATDATFSPFEYMDNNGNLAGFDIELMTTILTNSGININWVNVPFDSVLSGIENCQYDAAIAALSITTDRENELLFSTPYYNANGEQYGIAVCAEKPELLEIINNSLSDISNSNYITELTTKYIK